MEVIKKSDLIKLLEYIKEIKKNGFRKIKQSLTFCKHNWYIYEQTTKRDLIYKLYKEIKGNYSFDDVQNHFLSCREKELRTVLGLNDNQSSRLLKVFECITEYKDSNTLHRFKEEYKFFNFVNFDNFDVFFPDYDLGQELQIKVCLTCEKIENNIEKESIFFRKKVKEIAEKLSNLTELIKKQERLQEEKKQEKEQAEKRHDDLLRAQAKAIIEGERKPDYSGSLSIPKSGRDGCLSFPEPTLDGALSIKGEKK